MNPISQNFLTSLKALPRAVWFIFAGTFINRCGMLVVPFLTLYLTRHGFTTGNAATALVAYGFGNLFASLIGGHLADTIGRRNTIVISMFTTSVAMCILPQADTLAVIIALTFLTGLTGEIYRPAVNALIADIVPMEHRVTAYAANRTALNAGWAFGPAMAGLLAKYSWHLLFYADAATSIIYGLIALRALPHGNRSARTGMTMKGIWIEAFTNVPFLLFAGANFLVAICFNQFNSTFSLLVTDRGFELWIYGLLNSLNGLLVVCVELPLTSITRRFAPRKVIACGYSLCGAGLLLAMSAQSITGLLLVIIVFTLGEIISMPMCAAHLAAIAPENYRGRYMGVFGLTWGGALIIGPAAGINIYAVLPDLWWLICGGLGILAGALMLIQPKRRA